MFNCRQNDAEEKPRQKRGVEDIWSQFHFALELSCAFRYTAQRKF